MTIIKSIPGGAPLYGLLLLVSFVAASHPILAQDSKEPPSPPKGTLEGGSDDAFRAEALRIAKEYPKWMRISDRARWAPKDCRIEPPSGAIVSTSVDSKTHGQKLYFLFAKDDDAYVSLSFPDFDQKGPFKSPVGQVLVKESWIPEEVDPKAVPKLDGDPGRFARIHPLEYAFREDGKVFRAKERAPLFLMFKLDPKTQGTDEGWVYATLTSDGSSVIEIGRIASCMSCHTKVEKDRLFGMPRSWPGK